MNSVVLDEGPEIKQYRVESVDKCKQLCIKISNCNSFKYCQTQGGNGKDYCHLKDKTLYGNEKMQFNPLALYRLFGRISLNVIRRIRSDLAKPYASLWENEDDNVLYQYIHHCNLHSPR